MREIKVGDRFMHKGLKELFECTSIDSDEHLYQPIKLEGNNIYMIFWFGLEEPQEFNRIFYKYVPLTKPKYFNILQ